MTRASALPRIAREGWVPAGPDKRVNKTAMLIPKTGQPSDHIPTLMDFSEVICPAERRALREIIETAEVVREGDHLYLLARVSSATLDSLATFETSREDLEEHDEPSIGAGYGGSYGGGYEVDAELDTSDDEPNHDEEPDAPGLRRRFIVERQQPGRVHEWNGRRFVDPPSYDATKDQEELRKVKPGQRPGGQEAQAREGLTRQAPATRPSARGPSLPPRLGGRRPKGQFSRAGWRPQPLLFVIY